MRSIFLIVFKTRQAIAYLDNQDEVDQNIKSLFLFLIYGMVSFFSAINIIPTLINPYADMVFVVSFFIFFGVFKSLMLHKLNGWLSGNGSYADVQSIISHASVPFIFYLCVFLFCKILNFNYLSFDWRIIYLICWIISIKILIQGFLKYNNSSYKKMILNVSPLILFYIGVLLLKLLIRE